MGDGMSDASSICDTPGCRGVTHGSYSFCWSCRENKRRSDAAQASLRGLVTQQSQQNWIGGGNSMTKAKKTQASVMLVFPGPDDRRYRIVSFPSETSSNIDKFVIDEEREDTVGDKFWHPTGTWLLNPKDPKIFDLLMSAIRHLMNPNALIANDAELEGRKADAAAIMAQSVTPTPTHK